MAAIALTLLAACSETVGGNRTVANAPPAGPIAFEHVTGMPDSRAAELAAALAQRATARQLTVVGRDDATLQYRIKGYFAAQPSTERTTVSYIWDVFDKQGERVHRFDGLQQAPKSGAADPWGSVTPETIDALADAATSELARFLSGQNRQAGIVAPAPRPKTLGFSGPAQLPAQPVYYVGAVDSNLSDAHSALPQALVNSLASQGMKVTLLPSEANVHVTGTATAGKPKKGRQQVDIVWTATDPRGRKIGAIRQQASVLGNTLDHGWGREAQKAADAAGPAIIKMVSGSSLKHTI